jgi:hypothetical protein
LIEVFYITWKLNLVMKRKIGSLVFILTFSLILVPVVNAFCVELKYDDGIAEGPWLVVSGTQVGVKFSLPKNWNIAKLVTARYYIQMSPVSFEVHVYDLAGNDLVQPFTVTPSSTGWFDVLLNVIVSSDFIIAIEWIDDFQPGIGRDSSSVPQYRSRQRQNSTLPWATTSYNTMIRAEVCEVQPVGGELFPNSVSMIRTLIIAVISVVGITTGIALRKRKIF